MFPFLFLLFFVLLPAAGASEDVIYDSLEVFCDWVPVHLSFTSPNAIMYPAIVSAGSLFACVCVVGGRGGSAAAPLSCCRPVPELG